MRARPADERAAALAAACPDDPALQAEVQLLLDQPESAAGFLRALPPWTSRRTSCRPPPRRSLGGVLGVFEVQGAAGSRWDGRSLSCA